MAQNTSSLNSDASEKPKKVTKADFLLALDETNAILEKQIAEMRENQRQPDAEGGIKRQSADLEQLQFAVKSMEMKLEHFIELERIDRRNDKLELENRILQMEKRLPPASDN